MRYLIKYTKEADIKFIAHLDMLKTIQKNIRRAHLPIEYSQGFNPHMNTSMAQPLSVGVYSSGEYMDMVLTERMDEKEIINRLNETAPGGIKYISATEIVNKEGEKKVPQAMALIDAARYMIKIRYENAENLEEDMKKILEMPNWNALKKTKKGEKETDIKELVIDFKFWIKDNSLIINTVIDTGSRNHLNAALLADFIRKNTQNAVLDAFVEIKEKKCIFIKVINFCLYQI